MKKITVTVGIPAYNEEQNIEAFLRSIIAQKLQRVVLKKIFVYSDASSDRTNTIINKLTKTYPIITLIKGTARKGKYFRVNELFHRNTSDILIILDADIALDGNFFIETLATALDADPEALLGVAHNILLPSDGFIARILYAHFSLWDFIRTSSPRIDIAENYYGSATAYRKSFTSSVNIPSSISDPHFFIFLSAKKRNGFRYYMQAKILQYPPSTISDMKKLLNRSIGKRDKTLEKMFGKQLIQESLFIPTRAKIIGVWKCFLWNPLYTPLAILISFYLGRMVHPKNVDNSPLWEINKSTKKPMAYVK